MRGYNMNRAWEEYVESICLDPNCFSGVEGSEKTDFVVDRDHARLPVTVVAETA